MGRRPTVFQCPNRLGGYVELFTRFGVRGLPPQLLVESVLGTPHLGDLVDQVGGKADGLALVREGALDGLLDPP